MTFRHSGSADLTFDLLTSLTCLSENRKLKMRREVGQAGHLLVMRQGRLVGIVSDRELKEATPSKATTLDIHD